jgi:SAM-dependent methyltransferase
VSHLALLGAGANPPRKVLYKVAMSTIDTTPPPAEPAAADYPQIEWKEAGAVRSARWRSESGTPAPKRVTVADDRLTADSAYRLACEGTAILWRGDFQNARQLLAAMARRADKPRKPPATPAARPAPRDVFNLYRQAQSQRARTLSMLLLQFEPGHESRLRRAPDVSAACEETYGPANERYVVSMRELLGLIGAHEWRRKGIEIAPAGGRIHPHYGVFAPIRSEYVKLVAEAPLPSTTLAFDIGTGTGVLAAVLARRGVERVVATERDARALACARENIEQLGLSAKVEVVEADLFPEGRAPLIVCNPPWIPARPSSPMERAVYDEGSGMLRGFLGGLAAHLEDGGEGWLVLSDIAEHLGLRTRDELLGWIESAGLKLVERYDTRPNHPKTMDRSDPLFAARTAEVTSLWRLAVS